MRVDYGGFSVLLPGDAETHERAWWEHVVPDLLADATVLKLAHHGSRNGTDDAWLDLVRPHVAKVFLCDVSRMALLSHSLLSGVWPLVNADAVIKWATAITARSNGRRRPPLLRIGTGAL